MQKHELESCGRFLNVDDQAVTNSRQENFRYVGKNWAQVPDDEMWNKTEQHQRKQRK